MAYVFVLVQAGSRDQESVAQHYSSELVGFVRRALEAVPVIMFEILRAIMGQQSKLRVRRVALLNVMSFLI